MENALAASLFSDGYCSQNLFLVPFIEYHIWSDSAHLNVIAK